MHVTASTIMNRTILLAYYSSGLDRGKVIVLAEPGQEMLAKVPTREPVGTEPATAKPADTEPTTPVASVSPTENETPSTSRSAKRGRGRLKTVESTTKESSKDRYENVKNQLSANFVPVLVRLPLKLCVNKP